MLVKTRCQSCCIATWRTSSEASLTVRQIRIHAILRRAQLLSSWIFWAPCSRVLCDWYGVQGMGCASERAVLKVVKVKAKTQTSYDQPTRF